MRMWDTPTEALCDRHLLGEHVEMHMFVGAIRKGKSIQGYLEKKLVDTSRIQARHDLLAAEMTRRMMKHKSPMRYSDELKAGEVDPKKNLIELRRRCKNCSARGGGSR